MDSYFKGMKTCELLVIRSSISVAGTAYHHLQLIASVACINKLFHGVENYQNNAPMKSLAKAFRTCKKDIHLI